MLTKFEGYQSVGSIAVGPQDRQVLVGSFSLKPGDNTVWIRVTQTSPPDVWSYSYGLLTWKSSNGKELGTVKVYGDLDSEVFTLGVGLPPTLTQGSFYFTPRAYNRRWIDAALPPIWALDFEARSGVTGGSGSPFGIPATLASISVAAGSTLAYELTDGFAYLITTT